jgi:hypothetical protein
MEKRERNQEQRLRKRARRREFAIRKSRARNLHFDNQGLYVLVDYNNFVVLGERFDASLDEIEEYLKDINPL